MRSRSALIFVLAAIAVGCADLQVGCGTETHPTYAEPVAGSYEARSFQLKTGDVTFSVQGAAVTNEFFKSAKVPAMLGRLFIDPDAASGAVGVAVLSGDFWDKQFGSDPSIIGRTIEVDGRQTTVVGVVSRGFQFPKDARLWIPR